MIEEGMKVKVSSHYNKDDWYMGRLLKADQVDVTIGEVTDTITFPRAQFRVHITGGHLLNNPLYNHDHVWYCTDQDHVTIEVLA